MDYLLRPWKIDDIDNLVSYANNAKIANYLTDKFPHPYTPEDGMAFIRYANNHEPVSVFAIEVNGEASGGIGLHPQNDIWCKNAELGYWLAEHLWGQGIISNAVKEIVNFGFETFSIDRIFARPFGSNIGSQRVLEKAGFYMEARLKNTIFKNGKYEDEMIYSTRRSLLYE